MSPAKKFLESLLCHLPVPIARRLYPAVRTAMRLVRPPGDAQPEGLEAVLREENGLRGLFVGSGALAPYWQNVFFRRIEEPGHGTVAATWSEVDFAAEFAIEIRRNQFILANLPRGVVPPARGFIIPDFVNAMIPLPPTEEEFTATVEDFPEARKELHKFQRNGFTYRVSRRAEDVKEFYDTCHRPYILARHGKAAHVDSFEEFLRYFLNGGGLLVVERDGQMASGVLFKVDDDKVRGISNGVRDADPELLQAGALAAQYYYMTIEAIRMGRTQHDLGTTRPFLKDGVLQFKRKWGGVVRETTEFHTDYHLIPGKWNAALGNFLENNPFLARVPGAGESEFVECVFLHEAPEETESKLAGRLRRLHYPGARGMVLFPLSAAWQARVGDAGGLRDRVDFPLEVVALPLGAEGMSHANAWPKLLDIFAEKTREFQVAASCCSPHAWIA